jgi:hypothetical protein
MSGREALQIGRAAPGKMRGDDPEMVEKLGESGLDRAVLREFSDGGYGCSPSFCRPPKR